MESLGDQVVALRTEIEDLRKQNHKMSKENLDQKDQIRTLNDNLKREAELAKNRENDARRFGEQNRTLEKLLVDSKETYKSYKDDQDRLNTNLRI